VTEERLCIDSKGHPSHPRCEWPPIGSLRQLSVKRSLMVVSTKVQVKTMRVYDQNGGWDNIVSMGSCTCSWRYQITFEYQQSERYALSCRANFLFDLLLKHGGFVGDGKSLANA